MHDRQMVRLYECQVMIMHNFEVMSIHVFKPCYISKCCNIDAPYQFNVSLQHVLVSCQLFVVINTFRSSSIILFLDMTLTFVSYFSLCILFLDSILDYERDSLNQNFLFFIFYFLKKSSLYVLITKATISELECIQVVTSQNMTKFMDLEQENQRYRKDV